VKLLDALKLHFTIEDCFAEAGLNKQIFEEMAELLCDFFLYPLYLAGCLCSAPCLLFWLCSGFFVCLFLSQNVLNCRGKSREPRCSDCGG
jgi:hypothetical protein